MWPCSSKLAEPLVGRAKQVGLAEELDQPLCGLEELDRVDSVLSGDIHVRLQHHTTPHIRSSNSLTARLWFW